MKIAVCDDEKVTLDELEALLNKYAVTRQCNFEFELFEHYSSLADRLEEFDVFLLDYKMPDIDGLDFAKKIFDSYGEKKTIVFITAYPEIVYDSFEVRTFRFLVKPVKREDLFKTIDSVLKLYASRKTISVKSGGETLNVDVKDIYYITVTLKDVHIHLKNCSYICHKTLDYFEKELASFRFFRTHREYLVNMDKIRSFDSKKIIMKNGNTVLMSPRRYSNFNDSFFND